MVFGECRRGLQVRTAWLGECRRVRATQLGECWRVWRVRATRLGECRRVWRVLAKVDIFWRILKFAKFTSEWPFLSKLTTRPQMSNLSPCRGHFENLFLQSFTK